jgi:quaternary ammonium compound-resistance protein SugE
MGEGVAAMNWVYLIVAGVMECGWPVGLKFAWTDDGIRAGPAALAVAAMLLSGGFLLLAQRTIPIGTAYAVWTGIGAVGTLTLGVLVLGEPAKAMRFLCAGLIVAGIVGLKITSGH